MSDSESSTSSVDSTTRMPGLSQQKLTEFHDIQRLRMIEELERKLVGIRGTISNRLQTSAILKLLGDDQDNTKWEEQEVQVMVDLETIREAMGGPTTDREREFYERRNAEIRRSEAGLVDTSKATGISKIKSRFRRTRY